ncbi:MAG: flagellar type III secretion system pore protein FliP [Pseudomonadales bacterium]|nr:flagellar type III secretion system pore protein FliP [Pseudomonadales bacterium]
MNFWDCLKYLPLLCLFFLPEVNAAGGIPAITVQAGSDGTQEYSVSLQILALMTALTLLPAILLSMTAFTRIIIVLAILRQAMGLAQTPSNQVLLGLTLFLTFFIMEPTFKTVYEDGYLPYANEELTAMQAFDKGILPIKVFMLNQTRESDLQLYADISGAKPILDKDSVPLSLLIPAFVTSELKTAFQIGFLIFTPFVVIDMVVASVLMSMGMMMLSPMIVSLPFKIMLFVLVDGWALIMGTLASSFYLS